MELLFLLCSFAFFYGLISCGILIYRNFGLEGLVNYVLVLSGLIGAILIDDFMKKGVTKMAEEKSKVGYCPSCGLPAIQEGNKITCAPCDTIFRITKEGAKVEKTGMFENHERRLSELEAKVGKSEQGTPKDEPEESDI